LGPGSICAEERIGEDDEFSHDGCNGDLGGLSSGDKGLIFGFHVGVVVKSPRTVNPPQNLLTFYID
jgi:hypothetical protein